MELSKDATVQFKNGYLTIDKVIGDTYETIGSMTILELNEEETFQLSIFLNDLYANKKRLEALVSAQDKGLG